MNQKKKIVHPKMAVTAADSCAENRVFKSDETDAAKDRLESKIEINNELEEFDVNGIDFQFLTHKGE